MNRSCFSASETHVVVSLYITNNALRGSNNNVRSIESNHSPRVASHPRLHRSIRSRERTLRRLGDVSVVLGHRVVPSVRRRQKSRARVVVSRGVPFRLRSFPHAFSFSFLVSTFNRYFYRSIRLMRENTDRSRTIDRGFASIRGEVSFLFFFDRS